MFETSVAHYQPPRNRAPRQDEIETCKPRLLKKLEQIDPEIVVLLGRVAERACGMRQSSREARAGQRPSGCRHALSADGTAVPARSRKPAHVAQQRVSMDEYAGCACCPPTESSSKLLSAGLALVPGAEVERAAWCPVRVPEIPPKCAHRVPQ